MRAERPIQDSLFTSVIRNDGTSNASLENYPCAYIYIFNFSSVFNRFLELLRAKRAGVHCRTHSSPVGTLTSYIVYI